MLKKKNRLSKRSEFLKLKKEGTVKQSPFFGFSYLKKNENEGIGLGFIISKKISKRAVDRNKIKRVLCSMIEKKSELLGKNVNGIFLIKQSILKADRKELEKEVERVIKNV